MSQDKPKKAKPEPEAPAVEAQPRAASKQTASVVYRDVEGAAFAGQYLTVTVLDETVTLKLDQPQEVAADVAAALLEIESDLYVIEKAERGQE